MGHMKDIDRRIRQGGDDAIAAVSELMPRWISVEERLPDLYPQRLAVVLRTGKIVATHRGHDYIDGPFWSGIDNWFDVTHWMPLPEPPEVTK